MSAGDERLGEVEVTRLDEPVLYRYYEKGWRRHYDRGRFFGCRGASIATDT